MMLPFQTSQGRVLLDLSDIWAVFEDKKHPERVDLRTQACGDVTVEHTFDEVFDYLNTAYSIAEGGSDDESDDE